MKLTKMGCEVGDTVTGELLLTVVGLVERLAGPAGVMQAGLVEPVGHATAAIAVPTGLPRAQMLAAGHGTGVFAALAAM